MSSAPRCSIVIPVFNQASLTRQCLDLLLQRGHLPAGTEIIVVDDGSRDMTPRLLSTYGDRIRTVSHAASTGFATACNDGAATASGDLLVFLNNDTLPRLGWLTALRDYVAARPRVGAAGPKLLFADETVQHAGLAFAADGTPVALYTGFPADHPAVMKSRRMKAVTGACLMVRRGLFEDLDGFDVGFRNTYEDIDFCLRLGALGHEVHYCHESVLVHLFAMSRDNRHLERGPLGDIELAKTAFAARWSTQLEPDETRYYVEDGLLAFGADQLCPRTLSVSPLLASATADLRDASQVDRVLAERAHTNFFLARKKAELEAQLLDFQLRATMNAAEGAGSNGGAPGFFEVRRYLSNMFLHGSGIEVGALHSPLPVSPPAIVRYVDRMTVAELRRQYPELDALPLIEPDVIDDGETLATIADASQDFVIANHFLEHTQDPIGAVKTILRVLRAGGVAYLAVPDKRFTFDRNRPLTTLDHLIRDHEEGPAWSRRSHFEEWATLAEDENIRGRSADELMAFDYSIHFHVWTQREMAELFAALTERYALPFELEAMVKNVIEVIFILRKQPLADPVQGA